MIDEQLDNKELNNREKLQLDGNKMLLHLDAVQTWRKDQWKVNPLYIAFSPSSMCSHKCVFCLSFVPYPKTELWDEIGVKYDYTSIENNIRINNDIPT
jgi:hypothetical protein